VEGLGATREWRSLGEVWWFCLEWGRGRKVFMADCSYKWLFECTSKRNTNLDQGVSVSCLHPP
jgi:hypothetical protein